MESESLSNLLPFSRRLRYALTPKKLYARYRAWRDMRRYEPELRMLASLVDPNRNAIDGGAHRGTYCFFLSRLCKEVYAFEPNPIVREYLAKVVAKNVKVSDAALSNEAGEATFTVPKAEKGGYRNTDGTLEAGVYQADALSFKVPIVRLDDLNLRDIGFMKLDVEGHELAAIEGAKEIIKRDRPVLLVELMVRLSGKPIAESVAAIEAYGYRCMAMLGFRLLDYRVLDSEMAKPHQPDDPAFRRGHNFIFFPTS